MDFQQVTIIGNLTNDPVVMDGSQGDPAVYFQVATRKKTFSGEIISCYHSIKAYHDLAVHIAPLLAKGKKVFIGGEIEYRTREKEGRKQYFTDIKAREIIVLTPKEYTAPYNSQLVSDDFAL